MSDNKLEILNKIDAKIETRILGYSTHRSEGLFEILEDVVYQGDTEALKALVDAGMDVNLQNRYGWTPLHIAIRRNHRDMVEYLLDNGADIDRADAVGWTPLMESIMDNMPELCALLVKRGADKSIANQRGATAMMLAKKFDRREMFQFLEK